MLSTPLKHVAFIMDGNGRWARKKGLPHLEGHRAGANTLKSVLEETLDQGIPFLTVYAFSTENWKRPALEVKGLMRLLNFYLKKEIKELVRKNVRLRILGDRTSSKFSKISLNLMKEAEEKTAHNTALTFNIALNYGGRQEILEAVKKVAGALKTGELKESEVNEASFSSFLYTRGMPDPDLVIRTSGEYRTSNFLLWQSAYAEYFFTDTLWPDFSKELYREALKVFQGRERRFGQRLEGREK